MPHSGYSVLLLAGGNSTRFQVSSNVDKLFYEIEGSSVLHRTMNMVSELSDDILISINSETRKVQITDHIRSLDAAFLMDNPELSTIKGPLRGLLSSIPHCRSHTIILACDYPFMRHDLLEELITQYKAHDVKLAILSSYDGQIHNLLMVIDSIFFQGHLSLLSTVPTSRVSNLIRLSPDTLIMQMKQYSLDLLNMNQIEQLDHGIDQSSHSNNIEYDISVISPKQLFHEYLLKRNAGASTQLLSSLLQQEFDVWEGFSVQDHIRQDIDYIQ